MENYKELIKSFTKEDYLSGRVNLHIHTKYSDGELEFSEVLEQVEQKGLRCASVTDHNTVKGHLEFTSSKIITGAEFDVWYKYIFLHLLAYGIDVNNPELAEFYAKNKRETEADIVRFFAKRDIKKLINAIHNAGGIAVLAHPCCCWALCMETFIKDLVEIGLDGVEVYYPYPRWRKYVKFSNADTVERLADKYNLIKTGGTDCHSKEI